MHAAYRRAIRDAVHLRGGEAIQKHLDQLDHLYSETATLVHALHPRVSATGAVVTMFDPLTGAPMVVPDATVNLAAIREARALLDQEARLLGIYAPSKRRVDEVTMEDIEAMIADDEAAADDIEADLEHAGDDLAPWEPPDVVEGAVTDAADLDDQDDDTADDSDEGATPEGP